MAITTGSAGAETATATAAVLALHVAVTLFLESGVGWEVLLAKDRGGGITTLTLLVLVTTGFTTTGTGVGVLERALLDGVFTLPATAGDIGGLALAGDF